LNGGWCPAAFFAFLSSVRPRGSTHNPPNRFEALRYVPSAAEAAALAEANPETRLLSDPSRTIVATNTSPDVGFDASVNPYRGCEHACSYCLAPETPILFGDLGWRPIGEARAGDVLVGFDEYPARGRTRELRPARVQRVWRSRKPTLRIVTEKAEVVTTAEHRWLAGDGRWRRTDALAAGRALLRLPALASAGPGIEAATSADRIEAIEPGPVREVIDIQTSTRTFFAAGLATHNCYARPTHEYLGFSAGIDFETRILVKERAPELLRQRLAARSWKPQVVALSGVTDPYQPAERRLELTRRCLAVLAEFRNPVWIVTKSFLVTRDVDLLRELARFDAVSVAISITTLDAELQRRMEPYAAPPGKRLAAIERLAAAGVPVGVMVAPVVPGLTDHEAPKILEAAAAAGAQTAGRVVLRLPHGVAELFESWLALHYPERREKVMSRIRALRGGRSYDARFGVRQRGTGFWADQMAVLFDLARRRAGLAERGPTLSTAHFRRPSEAGAQLTLL
jgi:DNA repair photolyase